MSVCGGKLLIVDDEPDVTALAQAVLADDGYTFVTAGDGEEGFRMAKTEKPDLILLEVQMPKKDGFQTFGDLRRDEATKHIPVIMLTAVTARTGIRFDGKTMGEYFGSEPEAYLDKPIEPSRLRDTVKRLVCRK